MTVRQPAEWNASIYHQISNPHITWGRTVLEGLELLGDEIAVDAGCGSGRLTTELLERLPNGRVIAIDRSANMVEQARQNLEPFGDRVSVIQADVSNLSPEVVGETVDLVFSTATFHWIPDHPRLFRGIYRILKPGGRISAQCGGGPNLDRLLKRARTLMASPDYSTWFGDWPGPWEFAGDSTTAKRLADAGFVDIDTWLYEAPTPMADAEAYRSFLTNVIMGEHLARLPEEARAPFIDALTDGGATEDPPFVFDYWRLNMRATRPLES
jgi:trans-aconitate methyltransferase